MVTFFSTKEEPERSPQDLLLPMAEPGIQLILMVGILQIGIGNKVMQSAG